MSYDNLNQMTINENEYDDLCLKYGKARVDREIELELESKEDAFNSYMSKRNKAIKELWEHLKSSLERPFQFFLKPLQDGLKR